MLTPYSVKLYYCILTSSYLKKSSCHQGHSSTHLNFKFPAVFSHFTASQI